MDTLAKTFGLGGSTSQRRRRKKKRKPKMVTRAAAVRMAKAANRKGYRAGKRSTRRRY